MSMKQPTMGELVGQYANAIGRHGPDCPLALRIRTEHAGNREFLGYADALDRVKWYLGGSGVKAPDLAAHPIAPECRGEKCWICGDQAHHKVGEEIFDSELAGPNLPRHNLTAYLCCRCFCRTMGGTGTPWCEPKEGPR